MVEDTTLYDTLGVTSDATESQIKAAYRKLALKYHPEKHPNSPEAAEKFNEASVAFEILSNSTRRQMYDRYGVTSDDQETLSSYGDSLYNIEG